MIIFCIIIISILSFLLFNSTKTWKSSKDKGCAIDFKKALKKKVSKSWHFHFAEYSVKTERKDDGENKQKTSKVYIDEKGYFRFKDSNILVHRWKMEKNLGRKLCYEEVVHHIDGNKLNNNIENLRLFANQKEHDRHHRKHFKNHGTWHETVSVYARQNAF